MPKTRRLVVFTDLDGTLLDHDTYSFEAARETLALMEVVAVLRRIATRLGATLSGFSTMSVQEVSQACDLSLADARRARCRQYDEPSRLLDATNAAHDRLCRALRRAGPRCVSGGRFDHVTGSADKGRAVAALQSLYRRAMGKVLTVGLGDSANDLPLLRAVRLPVIVGSPAAGTTAYLRRQLPAATGSRFNGPAGWAEAVSRILTAQNVGTCSGPRTPGAAAPTIGARRRSGAARVGDA